MSNSLVAAIPGRIHIGDAIYIYISTPYLLGEASRVYKHPKTTGEVDFPAFYEAEIIFRPLFLLCHAVMQNVNTAVGGSANARNAPIESRNLDPSVRQRTLPPPKGEFPHTWGKRAGNFKNSSHICDICHERLVLEAYTTAAWLEPK